METIFSPGQILHLPELAEQLRLGSPEFRVDQVLKGGMGECIRIVQGDMPFSLKVIQREITGNDEAWERYLREVRLWMTLSACTGVVEALCLTRINEIPVVCARWMHGGNLRPYIKNRAPEFFFAVMSRTVGTLRWVHEQHKIIHRDLKPDNILLDETGLAYVSDWGLARPLTVLAPREDRRSQPTPDRPHPALTAAGSFLGTVSYASPEQLLGAHDLDHRADIYSLGCVMYEWETTTCPFTGTTAEEICLKHLFQRPRQLGGLLRRTTFGAESIIQACLEKEPGNRPADYASLDRALAQAASARGVLYQTFHPDFRYEMPMVGAGQYREHIHQKGVWNKAGTYAVVEQDEIEQFLREAEALAAVGDYRKAAEIYGSLFVSDAISAVPDFPYNQHVAIGYAYCLIELGRIDEAMMALDCLARAKEKPAEYFSNLSLAQIMRSDNHSAASTAADGLRLYPNNPDLIGNLLNAQTAMGAFGQAAETAKIRLARNRDVHSLTEVATLHCKYGDSIREFDWPLAVKNFRYAVGLLREAKELNPRSLPTRLQLPVALELMTAYGQCSDEIAAVKDLPLHLSDRVFLAYLFARCLDRVNDYKGCWEFCDGWLKRIAEVDATNPVPRHNVVRIERVRAVTIADGFCIGKMKDGQRVIPPVAAEFFAHIVHDEQLREAGDFCYLARLHEWMEEYERAHALLTEAQSIYPEYWEIPFQRAAFRARAGKHQEAADAAEQAASLAPWKPQTWRLLAETYTHLAKADEAEAARKRADDVQRIRDQLANEIDVA